MCFTFKKKKKNQGTKESQLFDGREPTQYMQEEKKEEKQGGKKNVCPGNMNIFVGYICNFLVALCVGPPWW